ncbi:TPA: orc1/cdc6 family replication initiation protein [archaeon]|uniref:ORC1-type DNA replication protein n=1 Tax=Candidatus Naiadarchaeum limnaeum TaxID=2756139 RepID=A0A832V1C5_9ARCH|nr:orc1/cdc6 family replication initiation protein [Candidatus Naiadarchaeum limnaeum]
MAQKSLQDLFDIFLNQQPLFIKKEALQETHTPENVPHREEQVKQLATILVHTLRGEKPSNIFIYGKTGTGKTLVSKFICGEIGKRAKTHGLNLIALYLNCKIDKINTPYRLFAHILYQLGEQVPVTGLPTEEVYRKFIQTLDKNKSTFILILDEIDSLTDTSTLYNLTRVNTQLQNSRVSLIGISNSSGFTNNLDPRIRSSLSEEELVFPPYNAPQLKDILFKRAEIALRPGVLEEGVIEKCAALAAQEHGDARRALDLLRVAVELAERNGEPSVTINHVDTAQKKIDTDRVVEIIKTQPRQSQLVLYSIIYLKDLEKGDISTGDIFEIYGKLCKKYNLTPLTQRRVSDLISELEMLGLIGANIISKGRYGRTRTISLDVVGTALEKGREILKYELA